MAEVDLIIFDCDGVLVDSEVLSCGCLSGVLAGYGIQLGVEEAVDLFVGRSMTAIREHYDALGHALPEHFPAELSARVRQEFPGALSPIDGIGAVLDGLRQPICVASSSDLDRVSFSLGLTGLSGYFGDRL